MSTSRRAFLKGALATAGGLALGPTFWRRPAWATGPPQSPHLAFGADPSTTMNIVWSTPEPVASPALDLGVAGDFGTTLAAETRTLSGHPTNYHQVRLTGLHPGTTYSYRVRHDGGAAEPLTFTTAPPVPQPFTFVATGDQGANADAAAVTGAIGSIAPAFTIVAGDLAYADRLGMGRPSDPYDPSVWDAWFAQNAGTMGVAPWMPSLGNHDMEAVYGELGYGGHLARLAWPDGGFSPFVYAFRYGHVAVVALDANDVSEEISTIKGYSAGGQTQWLASTLPALRADPGVDFIVVHYHHCSYCTIPVHGSDAGPRELWGPLFEQHGVDLVVNGHNHGYERCHPIRGGAPSVEAPTGATIRSDTAGPTYLCAGGGGQASYPVFTGPLASTVTVAGGLRIPELAPWSAVRSAGNNFARIDVTPADADGITRMVLTGLEATGAVIDTVTLERVSAAAAASGAAATFGSGGGTPPGEADAAPASGPGPAAGGTVAGDGSAPAATGRGLARTGGGSRLLPAAAVAGAGLAAAAAARRSAPATPSPSERATPPAAT